jgi:hypothetical protein
LQTADSFFSRVEQLKTRLDKARSDPAD